MLPFAHVAEMIHEKYAMVFATEAFTFLVNE